jgi:CheY-like chemotaxis protein
MPTTATNTLRVLSLEDSVRDFELIHELIVDAGFDPEMVRVENEPGFIDALTNQPYDIILADFNLPEYDAFTALQKTLEICPEVPFLVVSGAVGEETAIELIKQGAVDYVLKDRPKRLISAITRALAEVGEKQARQLAEKELAERNRLFRIAGETARFGGWRVDLDTNTCTWSDIVAEIHEMPSGYSPPWMKRSIFTRPNGATASPKSFGPALSRAFPMMKRWRSSPAAETGYGFAQLLNPFGTTRARSSKCRALSRISPNENLQQKNWLLLKQSCEPYLPT